MMKNEWKYILMLFLHLKCIVITAILLLCNSINEHFNYNSYFTSTGLFGLLFEVTFTVRDFWLAEESFSMKFAFIWS